MKYLRGIWLNVVVALLMCAAAAIATVPQISGFTTQQDGNLVNASLWNSQIGGIYTYLNQNIVSALNTLATKGDLLTVDGSATLKRFGVGSDGQVLVADSTQTTGLRWGSIASVSNLSAKGDLLTFDGSVNQRLGVGTDGQVLVSRSTAPYGVDWETVSVPSGVIALWSGAITSIPSGWVLCDGTNSTPNLQGLFVVGAGATSPAASGGMGLLNPGGPSGDTSAGTGLGPSHNHGANSNLTTISAYFPSSGFQSSIFYTGSSQSVSVGVKTVTPRYYALCYIMKQ